MKIFGFIMGMACLNRALMWLFPNSDAICNYGLLPFGVVAAVVIVISEMKSGKVSVE